MKVTIIGAGKTGRGFLARLCLESGYSTVFIDKNSELINSLNASKKYSISFFEKERGCVEISGYKAFHNESHEALLSISEADIIFTSVSSDNADDLVPVLKKALDLKKRTDPIRVIAAENGSRMVSVISENFDSRKIVVSQAVVFCTTVEHPGSSLSIVSENYNELYYDAGKIGQLLNREVFVHRTDIFDLISRKLYTYNCINAIIAFNGYFKGYELLADAADDEDISSMVNMHKDGMDEVLAMEYGVPLDEQKAFSGKAVLKFSNREIVDPITRNIRDVKSKLRYNERLIMPLVLLEKYDRPYHVLAKTVGVAIKYGKMEGVFSTEEGASVKSILERVCGITDEVLVDEIISQI